MRGVNFWNATSLTWNVIALTRHVLECHCSDVEAKMHGIVRLTDTLGI
jgi:hypothetical protein